MNTQYDVIIAGAGPGGSTCALSLEHKGLSVLLLDKDQFPRDKICGDAVSYDAKRVLRKINPELEKELNDFAPKSNISGVVVYSPKFESLEIKHSWHCIKRIDFDNWLFQKATQSPAITVLQNTALKNVASNEREVTIETNHGQVFHSKVIVGCDGAHSLVAKKLAGFKMNRKHYAGAVRQYYQNIKGVKENTLEVYFLKGFLPGYFWIFPLSNQQANVGFGMLSQTVANRKIDLKKCLHQIIHQVPEVAARFEPAQALDEIKGFGLPLGSQKCRISGNRFMLCGDAASLIDPFSGEGIITAMESGHLAAKQIIHSMDKNDFSAPTLKAYDAQVYKKMWGTFKKHYYQRRFLGDHRRVINSLISIGNIPVVKRKIQMWFSDK